MAEITMPRLSDTMQEGTLARWLKKPGDEIKKGDVLAEIETDKATMDLEAYDEGTLQQILVQEGETVPIGQVVAMIGSGAAVQQPAPTPTPSPADASADGAGTARARAASPPQAEKSDASKSMVADESDTRQEVKASPLARRLAD